MEKNQNETPQQNPPSWFNWKTIGWMMLTLTLFNWLLYPIFGRNQITNTDYTSFVASVDSAQVKSVTIKDGIIYYTKPDAQGKDRYFTTTEVNDPGLVDRLLQAKSPSESGKVEFSQTPPEKNSPLLDFFLWWILPGFLFYWIWQGASRRMMKGDFLHNPAKYTELGAKLPKGALLVGPPGTGKTLIARAVAGEAKVPFFSISGSEFVQMFVGMGAAKVRDLFKQAGEKAPCIIFIDEIDAIGKSRDSSMGNDEREQTLNQLLTEMDGFDGNKGLVILAATNRPETLDKALLRPGRFDRRVIMELPDLEGRKAILAVHLKKVKHGEIDMDVVGRATAGSSGADIANIVNEAALRAVRLGKSQVETADLEESVETVIAGEQKKGAVISPDEKRIIAYHEIGHAMVAACQSHSAPVQKITIIPRTSGALGYTMQVDEGEKHLMSRDELLNRIATLTGGRVAEEVLCHTCTTGASNDIEKATQLARAMITTYGMSDKFGMMQLEQQTNRYLGGNSTLTCSPETGREIDNEVRDIISQAYQKAVQLINEHEAEMHAAAEILLRKETITGEEFMKVLDKKN